MSKAIIDKILRRFNRSLYIKELDAKRADYCVELAIQEMVTVRDMVYRIYHDRGEIGKVFA